MLEEIRQREVVHGALLWPWRLVSVEFGYGDFITWNKLDQKHHYEKVCRIVETREFLQNLPHSPW
jgi:hypothetical protein